MVEVILFFVDYVILIYLLLLVALLFAIRRLIISRREQREAVFGLEINLARHRQNQGIAVMIMIGLLALAELILVVFLAPTLPAILTIPTPTGNPAVLPANTIPSILLAGLGTGTPIATNTPGPSTCIPDQIMITSLKSGDQIRGNIKLFGTVNIPNFGFYKYEYSPVGVEDWITIQAGRDLKEDADLGDWDTSELIPGDYFLRLVVTDNEGRALPACIIQVRVLQP